LSIHTTAAGSRFTINPIKHQRYGQ
jgi:hypothetical protein